MIPALALISYELTPEHETHDSRESSTPSVVCFVPGGDIRVRRTPACRLACRHVALSAHARQRIDHGMHTRDRPRDAESRRPNRLRPFCRKHIENAPTFHHRPVRARDRPIRMPASDPAGGFTAYPASKRRACLCTAVDPSSTRNLEGFRQPMPARVGKFTCSAPLPRWPCGDAGQVGTAPALTAAELQSAGPSVWIGGLPPATPLQSARFYLRLNARVM
ncbi:MAG: hypothetical protein BMS9Abin10_0986 [Gammaproteobacteria bacterium]|nr:MAG: hypothetical protein BMS9Abin10_0986 [Gammaproteobacteria bacterium]